MDRRTVLALLGVAGAAGVTGGAFLIRGKSGTPKPASVRGDVLAWRNWSGNQSCYPKQRRAPADEAELQAILKESAGPIRVVGSGHSFSPLVPTDATLVSLDRMGGVKSVDLDAGLAVLGAGGKLAQLAPELDALGAAFPNLPDINKQSLGGAISTATHGTGLNSPSMSAEIQSIRLLTSEGETLDCSSDRNSDVFAAARVSLGVLGIITEVGYRVEPLHNLTRNTWVESYKSLMPRVPHLFETHRSFEFYYIPFTDYCLAIAHDKTDAKPQGHIKGNDTDGLMSLKKLRDTLSFATPLRRALARTAVRWEDPETVTAANWKLLSSERNTRFNEMEYHLPVDQAYEALDEIIQIIERDHPRVFFPVEVRYIKGDDAWISPFEGADRISIAVHAHFEDDYQRLFGDVEPVFKRRGGRPHWGKINSLGAGDFEERYAHWKEFSRVRRELDPKGKLLNSYLAKVFNVDVQT